MSKEPRLHKDKNPEKFFHYACNSDSRPDFAEAGVELKVTPYKEK